MLGYMQGEAINSCCVRAMPCYPSVSASPGESFLCFSSTRVPGHGCLIKVFIKVLGAFSCIFVRRIMFS